MEFVAPHPESTNPNVRPLDARAANPGEEIIRFARANKMTDHPYFQRMRREPPNLTALWAFFANLNQVTQRVPHWLARVVAESDDRAVQGFFSGILYDELGHGDTTKNHPRLLQTMVDGLDPWKPREEGLDPLAPGKHIYAIMQDHFEADPLDVWHIVGSLILGEVASRDMISALAEQVRLQGEADDALFEWVRVHDEVEDDHVEGSEEMARGLPASGPALASVIAGARWKHNNVWEWLGGLYRVTYGQPHGSLRANS